MKFGIRLPHSGPLAGPEAIRRIATECERLGYDSIWVQDHISYGRDWLDHRSSGLPDQITAEYEPDFYEAVATLAYVAGITERIRLGTSIIVLPLRNPLVLGRQIITLQALSGGRLVLGVGVGDYPAEFRALNVPYEARGRITDEYLDVLGKVLQGGTISYHGKYINCDEAYFYPRVNPPAIFVGGGVIAVPELRRGRLAMSVLKRVASFGDGWMLDWGDPDIIREGMNMIRTLRHGLARQADGLDAVLCTVLYITDTDQEAVRATGASIEGAERVASVVARLGKRSPEPLYQKSLIGSPAVITQRIQSYAAAGVTGLVMKCLTPDLDTFVNMIERFQQEVVLDFR